MLSKRTNAERKWTKINKLQFNYRSPITTLQQLGMENQASLLSLLVLAVLFIQCCGTIEMEKTFEIDSLSPNSIAIDIHSEIPGQITWIYTDDHNFHLKINIFGEDENAINSTDINLTTTNTSVKFFVREKYFLLAPAPVTGTGSALRNSTYLVWLLALLIGWNNRMPVLFIVAVCGFSPGIAETTYDTPKKSVIIEVKAPRRLSYKTVNMYINGGKLRVVDWAPERMGEVTCKTQTAADDCPNCCHGNGVCVMNQCICDGNYAQETNCALSKREDLFFSHPLDPRFGRTRLPGSDILTLGRAFQFIQQPQYLKDPEDIYAMEIKSRDVTMPRVLITIQSDGFIEKIIDAGSAENNVIKFKRSRLKPCLIRLKGHLINTDIDICDRTEHSETERTSKEDGVKESISDRKRDKENKRKNKRNKQRKEFLRELQMVEFPVRIHRCGYNSHDRKFVYFQMFTQKIDQSQGSGYQAEHSLSLSVNENIILLSHEIVDGTTVLRLPDNSSPLGSEQITAKCEKTKSLHGKICSSSNLENLRIICDNISNITDRSNFTSARISRTTQLCIFVFEAVTSYCDKPDYLVLSKDEQYANFVNIFDSFSNSYNIRPVALFPDEKTTISGQVQVISLHNNTRETTGNKELTIIDNDAEFDIVKISVIPKDPVPHDIYQVKLDYACATSQTAIKMTVYGSDFYSNSVVCRGITQCNCCILHAAGAPNAVVDHVTINVTDPSRNYKLVKEMVVVF